MVWTSNRAEVHRTCFGWDIQSFSFLLQNYVENRRQCCPFLRINRSEWSHSKSWEYLGNNSPIAHGFWEGRAHFWCVWPIFPNSSVKFRAAAGGSEMPFCFQKSPLSLMYVSIAFSWGISLGLPGILSVLKKRGENKTRCTQGTRYTSGRAVHSWHDWCSKVVFFSELWFRAPTKNWALRPQIWEGAGGPWMKGRARAMVNHRVKHTTRGWGQAARHHRERKDSPCTMLLLPHQSEPTHMHVEGLTDQITPSIAWKHSVCHCCGFTIQSAVNLPAGSPLCLEYV